MHRIDSAGNVDVLPAPLAGVNPPGHFNNNPGAGPGTVVTGDFLNAVQEEIANVIEGAGIVLSKASNGQLLLAIRALQALHGQCQLRYVSTVALALMPMNGNGIKVNGKTYAIPSAGIAIANTGVEVGGVAGQNLAVSTDYLLYVKDDGAGNLVPSFWAVGGGHLTDTTAGNIGVEVRSNVGAPDSTRTLIGMVGTDAAAHFADADGARLVLSWFNRRGKRSRTTFGSTPSTASGTPVELSTSIRTSFLVWSGDETPFAVVGPATVSAGNAQATTFIGFDGGAVELECGFYEGYTGSTTGNAAFSGRKTGLAEGRHYATLLGQCVGGTGSWYGGAGVGGVGVFAIILTVQG